MESITKDRIEHYGLEFSAEELEELKQAREMPITFDEDCPETTPERALRFRRVNPPIEELRQG